MSAVCVLTPLVIGSWPLIAAAVHGALASMGFAAVAGAHEARARGAPGTTVETELADSEVLNEELGESEAIVVEQDGLRIEFGRSARGVCKVCVTGNRSHAELERIGQEVAGRVTQQFVYHRLTSELERRNFDLLDERVQQDGSVRLHLRLGR